jgi:acyl carrier protein
MWDQQFEEILRTHLPFLPADEALTDNASLTDYGLDSLGIVDLLFSLESGYDVAFVDDALSREAFETPASLWQTVLSLRPMAA